MWNATGHWTEKTPPQLLAAYRDAIHLLDELDLQCSHVTIDKPKLRERYHGAADKNAYRLALQFLLEKLDRNVSGLKVIVADEAKQEQIYAQKILSGMQQWQWGGEVPGQQLNTVIDSLHFVRSEASPGVQLADLAVFVLQRAQRGAPHKDAQVALDAMRATIGERTPTWREPWPA